MFQARLNRCVFVFFGLFLCLLLISEKSFAAQLYVSNSGSDLLGNDCQTVETPCETIAYAITQANAAGGDSIHLSADTYVVDADVVIDRDVSFVGAGIDDTIITELDASLVNLFTIAITVGTPTVSFQDLAMTRSDVDNLRFIYTEGTAALGGVSADLLINNVRFTGGLNESSPAIYFYSSGALEINDCEFINNRGTDTLGGVILESSTSLLMTDTVFDGNTSAGSASNIYTADVGNVAILRSTFANSENATDSSVVFTNTPVTLTNVSFVNNTADDGAESVDLFSDITLDGAATAAGFYQVTLYNAVDTDNYSIKIINGATLSSHHSILFRTDGHDVCTATATDDDYNLASDTSCVNGATDIITVVDPFVGVELADNGGDVSTLKVLAASPAFDSGGESCDAVEDARGVNRDPPIGDGCEIGAFESTCGNGVEEAEYGEECDDSDHDNADGCSADCEDETLWYADSDADGFGDAADSVFAVDQPVGYVANITDCDDADADISPAADELCDAIDNDCDASVDEDFVDLTEACAVGVGACEASGTMVCTGDGTATECDAAAGAADDELCDGIDNDCDGDTDEDFTDLNEACAVGVGACETSGTMFCTGDGTATECDASAGTPDDEVCDDTLDNDCDGDTDIDDTDCDVADDDATTSSGGGCALQAGVNGESDLQIGVLLIGVLLMGRIATAKLKS